MFPLYQRVLPANATELTDAIENSARRFLTLATCQIVSIRDKTYPALEEIVIDLSGGRLADPPPRRPSIVQGESAPALTINHIVVNAPQISSGAASLDLNIEAQNVVVNQGRDHNGDIVLVLQRAEAGRMAISLPQKDLEAMVGRIAKIEAAKQGVTIDEVRVQLRPLGPRSLEGDVELRVRKLFVRATIRIGGKLAIDNQLIVRISDLGCAGEGAIASLACNVLNPHLRKLEAREFPLMALSLGEIRIRDVRVEVDDAIKVTAEFGAPKALVV